MINNIYACWINIVDQHLLQKKTKWTNEWLIWNILMRRDGWTPNLKWQKRNLLNTRRNMSVWCMETIVVRKREFCVHVNLRSSTWANWSPLYIIQLNLQMLFIVALVRSLFTLTDKKQHILFRFLNRTNPIFGLDVHNTSNKMCVIARIA